jgi:hypothetical protein
MLLLGTAITSLVFFVAGVIPNQLPAVWTLTVVALVASVGGLVHLHHVRSEAGRIERASQQTTGTVEHADLHHGSAFLSSYTCEANLAVEYTVTDEDGSETTHTTRTVFPNGLRIRFTPDGGQDFLAEYEEGAETDVYVDPSRPRRAFIERRPTGNWMGRMDICYYVVALLSAPAVIWYVLRLAVSPP